MLKYRREAIPPTEAFRRKSDAFGRLERMMLIQKLSLAGAVIGALLVGGCGSSSSSSTGAGSARAATSQSAGGTTATPAAGSSVSGGSGGSAPGTLSADARSAATGDIPDNQVFLVLTNPAGGYSMKYPEGWTRSGSGHSTTLRDKNNLVQVSIVRGVDPTPASVSRQLSALKRSEPTLVFGAPRVVNLGSGPMVRVVYTTESAPNPVTGKRVKLIVDRYELAHAGHMATVDLGTPTGVDNIDAYRKMIASFAWR
jgi:hypothetical protein